MTRVGTALTTICLGGTGLQYFLNGARATGLGVFAISLLSSALDNPLPMAAIILFDLLGLLRMSDEEFDVRYNSGPAYEGPFIIPQGSKKHRVDFKKLREAQQWLSKGEHLICLGELALIRDDPLIRKTPLFWNTYLPAMSAVVSENELYKAVYEAVEEGVKLPLFNEKVKAMATRIEAEKLEAKRKLAAATLTQDGMSPLKIEEISGEDEATYNRIRGAVRKKESAKN